ncbi:arsenite efflux transporter metallochaperone ArsD [Sinobaca sp. H24]|uniref:arsenite efflux transporter metallochaperone ArsD n=1 Tax=Sinobaca sp. H24 TaxID=2923376 RepID=UPI00207AB845|nr:arsenite efflux transporter metallochaperone ArsD [Sinobaca sp. H24]
MTSIKIYDPSMCCSTGVCGPTTDPELTRVATALYMLENQAEIERYNLSAEPQKFIENRDVQQILQKEGIDALPLTFVNDECRLKGRYPSNMELAEWTETTPDELKEKKSGFTIDLMQK